MRAAPRRRGLQAAAVEWLDGRLPIVEAVAAELARPQPRRLLLALPGPGWASSWSGSSS